MTDLKESQITEAKSTAKNYPDLVQKLKAIGVKGYIFEVGSQFVTYRYADDSDFTSIPVDKIALQINPEFNAAMVKEAIVNNQQGRTDFPTFLKEIAAAGIKLYDADFDDMTVSYFGENEVFVEPIPKSL